MIGPFPREAAPICRPSTWGGNWGTSMDSTVELQYSNVAIPTFTDEILTQLIRAFRQHGFNVYLVLAFESGADELRPVQRWQLVDPMMHEEMENIHRSSRVYSPNSGETSHHIWDDLDLDIVCISAYFPLVDSLPYEVPGIEELETGWSDIFDNYLEPIKTTNEDRSIMFTEFGYVDVLASPHNPGADEFTTRLYTDANGNGVDDGEETQSNLYEAFFNTMDSHPGLVSGAFLWDVMMATEDQWAQSFGNLRTFSIRQKLAEEIVRSRYASWL